MGDAAPVRLPAGVSRQDALLRLRAAFVAADISEPAIDARLLLLSGLGITAAEFAARPEAALDDAAHAKLAALARRRLRGEPVGRILGESEFWGLPFRLGPDTLEPRADTETVVEAALAACRDPPVAILDLGVGSGCLLVALLSEYPCALGIGVDRSVGAISVARGNARRNRVGDRARFVCGDWGGALAGGFDLVVSNPPYIASGAIPTLPVEVAGHDPILALDGGADGLEAYRRILADVPRLLLPGGTVVVEIGQGQESDVAAIGEVAGLESHGFTSDLSSIIRAVSFRRKP